MDFCFYPRHEYACSQVGHCPHLGGAALATLVSEASDQSQYRDMLHGQLDFKRARIAKQVAENEELQRQVAQLRLRGKRAKADIYPFASRAGQATTAVR